MKKLLGTLLLSAIAFGGVVAQQIEFTAPVKQKPILKMAPGVLKGVANNNSSRSITKKFNVSYGAHQRITKNPSDSIAITLGLDLNNNFTNATQATTRYGIVFFDSLVDINSVNNTFTSYKAADYTSTLDTLIVGFLHENTTANEDTIIITVFNGTTFTTSGSGAAVTLNAPTLWADTIYTSTSSPKNAGDFTIAGYLPKVTLPKGHTFGVKVDFKGDTANKFNLITTFNNECNEQCFADTFKIPNSYFYLNFAAQSGFYQTAALQFPGSACPAGPTCKSLFLFDQNYFINAAISGVQECHTLSFTSTPAACGTSNGSATVTPTNEFAPYNYAWSTTPAQTTATASGLAAGKYKVTVTGTSGCVTVDSVTIVNSGGPNAPTVAKTDVVCFGGTTGTATATAAGGGTAPYTFAWSTSPAQTTATATGLAAGTYSVTIKDASNCINTANVTVGQTATAVSGTTSAVNAKCFGAASGTAVAVGSGGVGPYSYNWSSTPAQANDSALNVAAGTYTVTITDSKSCTATKTVTVGQPASAVSATVTTNNTAQGQQAGSAIAAVTGGTAPYTYAWDGSGSTTNTATGLGAGSYFVSVTDSKGCTDTTNFTISVISGIEQVGTAFSAVKVFPNPVKTDVTIQATLEKTENVTIEVIDITGKVVTTKVITGVNSVNTSLNLSTIARGTYTIKLSTQSGSVKNRIVLQ